jgi:hypothetical protein
MSLHHQITELERSLADFKPDQKVDWQVGLMANAMIEQAKQQVQGNAVIDSIEPFRPGPNEVYIGNATAGTVRAVLRQLASSVPGEAPLIG